ncbi:MAG: hypothetical protein IJR47_01935 [Clostridia bacterium]|nr:hypothetical protein [Clostridia bacterium]
MRIRFKKHLYLTAAVLLLASLCACKSNDKSYVGMWELSSVQIDKMQTTPEGLNMQASVAINEDGTAILSRTIGSESPMVAEGKWEKSENGINIVSANGDIAASLIFENNCLKLENREIVLYFTKQTEL